MKSTKLMAFGAAALISTLSLAARADHEMIRGRTGLPTVREGKGNVWIEKGTVNLEVQGNSLTVTQNFQLRYPGEKLEKGFNHMKVAVREDYYRSKDGGAGDVMPADAKGFTSFDVYVDDRSVTTGMDPWEINDKKDTATRWRTWDMSFHPGQIRHMRIVSRAPLGRKVNKPFVQFIAKDLGGWREKPDTLEIRLSMPGKSETRLAGVEPRPDDINGRAVRWVYRKADPNRDIFALLPATDPTAHR